MDIIGLALVEMNGKNYIFEMPKYCNLQKGDAVRCETKQGKNLGKVVCTSNVIKGGDEFELITNMEGVTLPLGRVIAIVKEKEIFYEDADE